MQKEKKSVVLNLSTDEAKLAKDAIQYYIESNIKNTKKSLEKLDLGSASYHCYCAARLETVSMKISSQLKRKKRIALLLEKNGGKNGSN